MACTTFASTNTTDISFTLEETCGTTPAQVDSTGNNISFVASTGVATGTTTTFQTDGLTAGTFIKITSATDPSEDGIYEVLAVNSETEFTIPANAMSADISQTDFALAGPAFQILPTTGGSPTGNTTTSVSEVIRSDRQTDDIIVTDQEISGSVNYELSYEPYKRILQGLLLDAAPVTINSTANNISIVASTGVATGTGTTFITDGIKKGMFIHISSATDNTQDGVYKIISVTSETVMNIEANAMSADLSETDIVLRGKIIRNGAAAPDNYTFLKRVVNGATTSYFYYNGIQISQMSFNFATGSILNGSFDVVGLSETATTTEKTGSVYDNPPAYSIMNSVSSVTAIDFGGASATTEFSDMNITINNNINQAKAIGTLGAAALASFTLDVMADSTIYFEDTTLYNQYLNSSAFYVDVTLQDGDGNIIVISMPKAKFESLDAPIDGKDNFMMQNGSLRALRDADENYMVQFSLIDA